MRIKTVNYIRKNLLVKYHLINTKYLYINIYDAYSVKLYYNKDEIIYFINRVFVGFSKSLLIFPQIRQFRL